jgi:acyl dehydratase
MTLSLEALLKLEPDEMLKYDETPSIEALQDPQQVYYDEIMAGQELPKYIRKYSIAHFQRWNIAMENTHRLHYDYPHAINHDKLPGVLFHGTWRMSLIAKWLKNWVLPHGWAWKSRWQVREMVTPGEITILWGKVIGKQEKKGTGLVNLEFGICNQDGSEGCPGTGTVALPLRGGPAIPYPFVPPEE